MEAMTFGNAWANGLFQAANVKAVMLTFSRSKPVSTRAMKRSERTRVQRKVSYGAGLMRYFASKRRTAMSAKAYAAVRG